MCVCVCVCIAAGRLRCRPPRSPLLQETLRGHSGQVWCVRARGPVLMTASTAGALLIHDLRSNGQGPVSLRVE